MSDGQTAGRSEAVGPRALAAVLIYLGAAATIGSALQGAGFGGLEGVERDSLAQGLALIAALVCFTVLKPPSTRGEFAWPRVAAAYLVFLIAWVPVALFAYPWWLARDGAAMEPQAALAYFAAGPEFVAWPTLVVVLVACGLAPLVEEIVFRGFVQPALRAVLPVWPAILVTATLFGLLHGIQLALPVGLLGVFFGWLRESRGGLAAPVLAHALHNTVTIAVTWTAPVTFEWVYG